MELKSEQVCVIVLTFSADLKRSSALSMCLASSGASESSELAAVGCLGCCGVIPVKWVDGGVSHLLGAICSSLASSQSRANVVKSPL